jgi:hypothetical protein
MAQGRVAGGGAAGDANSASELVAAEPGDACPGLIDLQLAVGAW